jgi:hypothetical protein
MQLHLKRKGGENGNIYNINVLTADSAGIIAQLDSLKQDADNSGGLVDKLNLRTENEPFGKLLDRPCLQALSTQLGMYVAFGQYLQVRPQKKGKAN